MNDVAYCCYCIVFLSVLLHYLAAVVGTSDCQRIDTLTVQPDPEALEAFYSHDVKIANELILATTSRSIIARVNYQDLPNFHLGP